MIASGGGGLIGTEYHDLTLSGLADAAPHARPADLRVLCGLIARFHPRLIEIAPSQVDALEGFDRARLCLRVSSPEAVSNCPGFGAYVMPVPAPLPDAPRGCGWLRLLGGDGPSHRLLGPDRPLGGAALKKVLALQEALPGGLQYCPTDGLHLATGNAVSLLLSGARHFAAAFGGVGASRRLRKSS